MNGFFLIRLCVFNKAFRKLFKISFMKSPFHLKLYWSSIETILHNRIIFESVSFSVDEYIFMYNYTYKSFS